MGNLSLLTLCCIILLFLHQGVPLICRSGNQQTDAQFQKVLKTCRNRYISTTTDDTDGSVSRESSKSNSDSSSEENVYDKTFFHKKDDKPSYNQSTNNQTYRTFNKNSNINTYSADYSFHRNIRDSQNIKRFRKINDRDSWNSRDSYKRNDFNDGDINNGDMHFNNNTDQVQACTVQCFFNELNVVDQKGFPERDLVIPLMSQNIQDPELKDFVVESIVECFRYLESNKDEKCEFSHNLLSCLAEKGQQKCEDWEN